MRLLGGLISHGLCLQFQDTPWLGLNVEEEIRVDDVIAADFESDSFQEREAPQLVEQGGGKTSFSPPSTLVSSEGGRGRFAEEGDQVEI